MSKRDVAFDFDGVLHTYKHWVAIDVIDGEPVKGMQAVLKTLKELGYGIKIYTCRAAEQKGIDAVRAWLEKYEMLGFVDEITAEKPIAICYVDDRAIKFEGNAEKTFMDIISFKSWTEVQND